jgi:hypothetical protein
VSDWPFDQSPQTAAITVQAVLDGDAILHVSHDADDDGWQFLDGRTVDIEGGRAISMGHALELDPSLRAISDLPSGWIARRESRAAPWIREPHPD